MSKKADETAKLLTDPFAPGDYVNPAQYTIGEATIVGRVVGTQGGLTYIEWWYYPIIGDRWYKRMAYPVDRVGRWYRLVQPHELDPQWVAEVETKARRTIFEHEWEWWDR